MTALASDLVRPAELPSISLEELVAQAAMLSRVDRKYVVPRTALPAILSAASDQAALRILEIDGQREFAYRSMYFDTPELISFRSAGQKRRRRFKVRTRTYLDSGATYLEVKVNGPRDTTIKTRIDHPLESFDDLTTGGVAYAADRLSAHGLDGSLAASLRPTLATAYRRATLHLLDEGRHGRATIDTDLTWDLVGPAQHTMTRQSLAIVETKAGATPTSMDRALWRLGHRPVRISKYGTGLAAMQPALAAMKWHHTLQRHLRHPQAA